MKANRFRIYQDEIKLRHTSHWDIDYLDRETLEAYMKGERTAVEHTPPPAPAPQQGACAAKTVPPESRSAWQRFLNRAFSPSHHK